MTKKLKSLIINFSSYTLVNLFNSLTPFIVLPILTRSLSPEGIGYIDLFSTSSIFLTPIIGLCFVQSITKLYYVYEDKRRYLSTLFSTVILISGCFTFLTGIAILIPNLIILSKNVKVLVFLITLYVTLNIIIEGFLLLKRNEEKIKEFAKVRLIKSTLDILLTIILLFFIEDYMFRVIAIVFSTIITSIYVIYLLIKGNNLKFNIDKKINKKILLYSTPLIFHTLFASILNYADRYFILDILDVAQLGKYSVAYQLCMVMSLLINSFNMAWIPYFMKNMTENRKEFESKFKKYFRTYTIVLLLASVILFFMMPIIYQIYVGENYMIETSIYTTLIIAYFFNGLYRFKVSYLFYYEKTLSVAKLSFIAAMTNLTLNYICIHKFGVLGAAISTFVSYFILYLLLELVLYINNKNGKFQKVY